MTDPRNHPSARQAVVAMDRFLDAWNRADNDALRQAVHYPYLSLFGGRPLHVAEGPGDFTTDFGGMRADGGWVKSTFDHFDVLAASDHQVHLLATYSRHNAAGETYFTNRALYIVTERDGHWAMQVRVGVGFGEPNPASLHGATATVEAFFMSWNKADNAGVHRTIAFPHAFILPEATARIAHEAAALTTNFERMREEEEWHRSAYSELDIPYADAERALVYLTFTRHKEDGAAYATVPALWIISRDDGRWGIQVRAIIGQM